MVANLYPRQKCNKSLIRSCRPVVDLANTPTPQNFKLSDCLPEFPIGFDLYDQILLESFKTALRFSIVRLGQSVSHGYYLFESFLVESSVDFCRWSYFSGSCQMSTCQHVRVCDVSSAGVSATSHCSQLQSAASVLKLFQCPFTCSRTTNHCKWNRKTWYDTLTIELQRFRTAP